MGGRALARVMIAIIIFNMTSSRRPRVLISGVGVGVAGRPAIWLRNQAFRLLPLFARLGFAGKLERASG